MKVTSGRVAVAKVQSQVSERTLRAPKTEERFADGFEVEKAKKKKPKTPPKAPVAVGPAVLDAGSRAVDRARTDPRAAVLEAATLLGGLTVAVVVGVLHQFDADAPSSRSVQRLGELTGALFLEYLATHLEPEAQAVVDEVVSTANDFGARFERAFGMSALDATRRFIDFIAQTEGKPKQRLAGTVFAA